MTVDVRVVVRLVEDDVVAVLLAVPEVVVVAGAVVVTVRVDEAVERVPWSEQAARARRPRASGAMRSRECVMVGCPPYGTWAMDGRASQSGCDTPQGCAGTG